MFSHCSKSKKTRLLQQVLLLSVGTTQFGRTLKYFSSHASVDGKIAHVATFM
uniref:Uncharacterized protein n=1 Tax=Romanomermis culicivorax TaxID=13658 RepID=A0A915HJX9_ROMCU